MMSKTMLVVAGLAVAMAGQSAFADANTYGCDEQYRPTLFKQFGNVVNVPDGLAQDKDGNIYCSAPNFKDQNQAAVIMRYDRKQKTWAPFVSGLRNPDTGFGAPMGLEFAEDGNLYYCDNQYFADKNYKSRIMRVTIKDGEAQKVEPVVENIKLANAIRVRGNAIYFTDTFGDIKGSNEGYVYQVPFSAFANGKVAKLLPKGQAASDPFCLGITQTTPFGKRKDIAGADGMCMDKDGNIYTGNFGDGRFYTIPVNADGSYGKLKELVKDLKVLSCVDGVCYYEKENWVMIADSEKNAIRYWDIDEQTIKVLWQNDDTDGSDGLLDQPCEVMVWQDSKLFGLLGSTKLIVVNFDWTFPGLVNAGGDETKNDKINTISVIDL
ncbi:MAG: hypothetical protein PF904_06560 [Kiritimatiellae bacterium]|nr:hypothetical protein [Kiritimatiellia bacterium]